MSDTLTSTKAPVQPAQAAGHIALRTPLEHDALAPGTRLDEFEIVRVLGAGGFGIVYLALDHQLRRRVAIKEYLPSTLAGRSSGTAVAMRSPAAAETFALGLESFFNEARLLACFDHPSLVKVYRCMKAHGTAYMVMQFYPGITLKQARRGMAAAPDGAWLRAIVEPLLDVLELLHGQGVFHRDIAPDNILILTDGRPVLLDFGSARRIVGDATQSLTAVLKPNFAPIEQYADATGMRQGPWTDLYALGATACFMLSGKAPVPAVLRAVRDELPALSAHDGDAFAGVPERLLAAIDWSLALSPDDRPQSVDMFRQALDGRLVPPAPSARHRGITPLASPHVSGMHTVDAGLAFGTTVEVRTATMAAKAAGDATGSGAMRRHGLRIALALGAAAGMAMLAWNLHSPAVQPPADTMAGSAAAPTATAAAATAGTAGTAAAAGSSGTPSAGAVAAGPAGAASAAAPNPASQAAAASAPSPRPAVATRRPTAASASVVARRSATPGAVLKGPEAACADLNFFTRAICVSRECQTPRWREHPQCVQARAIEEQRQRQKNQF